MKKFIGTKDSIYDIFSFWSQIYKNTKKIKTNINQLILPPSSNALELAIQHKKLFFIREDESNKIVGFIAGVPLSIILYEDKYKKLFLYEEEYRKIFENIFLFLRKKDFLLPILIVDLESEKDILVEILFKKLIREVNSYYFSSLAGISKNTNSTLNDFYKKYSFDYLGVNEIADDFWINFYQIDIKSLQN